MACLAHIVLLLLPSNLSLFKGNNFAFASEGQLNHEAASSGGTCRNITLLADSAGAIRNGVTAAAKGKSATNSSPMTMIDSLTKEDGVLVRKLLLLTWCVCAGMEAA